jgi:chorismate-pyruvate lyase
MATSLPGEPIPASDAASLLRDLCARLIAGPSATAVLEAWCRERGIAATSNLVAHAVPGPERTPSPAQRARLELPRDCPVRYRRVRLTCAGRVLSEAENWYVPDRLTPAMNHLLDTSEVPFGRVVQALAPSRRNLALRLLPAAGAPASADPHAPLFAIEALLLRGDGLPLCEVGEVYTGAILMHG